MKSSSLLLVCVLTVPAFAADPAPKPADTASAAKTTAPVMLVAEARITAPFVLADGVISQKDQLEVTTGGKAVFTLKVAKAGDYVIAAMVNAPDEDSNSFFLNIDAPPTDPDMIWDIRVTSGFEERIVSWRGNGDSLNDDIDPKVFKLTAGEHQLIIIGREPAKLKSVSIRPAAK